MSRDHLLRESRKMPIEAVIFDYGNVISLPQSVEHIRRMVQLCGTPTEQFHENYWKFRIAYDRGEFDGISYWDAVIAEMGGKPAQSSQVAQLISSDIQSWLQINAGSLAWLKELHERGVRLAILSNMPPEIARYIERHCDWAHCFDVMIFSCDIGCAKPSSAMYQECLTRLHLPASSALFLDDREENVTAAISLGMHSLIFDNIERIRLRVEQHFDLRKTTAAGNHTTIS